MSKRKIGIIIGIAVSLVLAFLYAWNKKIEAEMFEFAKRTPSYEFMSNKTREAAQVKDALNRFFEECSVDEKWILGANILELECIFNSLVGEDIQLDDQGFEMYMLLQSCIDMETKAAWNYCETILHQSLIAECSSRFNQQYKDSILITKDSLLSVLYASENNTLTGFHLFAACLEETPLSEKSCQNLRKLSYALHRFRLTRRSLPEINGLADRSQSTHPNSLQGSL